MNGRISRAVSKPLTWLLAGGVLVLALAAVADALHGSSPESEGAVPTTSPPAVTAASSPDRLPTCTRPQLELVIEVPGGAAAVALRHVSGAPCHLRRLSVKVVVRDPAGRVVPLVAGEGLRVSAFRGNFSPGFEQLRNVSFLPECTPETIPHASYLLVAKAGAYHARKKLSGAEIGCFGGG